MKDMTISEVSDVLGVNEITVRRSIQKIFPEILEHGKKTSLNEYHVTLIKKDITTKYTDKNVGITTELEEALIIAKAMQLQQEKIERLQGRLQEKESQVKRLVHACKLYTTTELAKELNLKSAQELNQILKEKNVQYFINGTWVLKSDYSDKNYESIKQMELDTGQIIYDRKWTGIGRDFILNLLKE